MKTIGSKVMPLIALILISGFWACKETHKKEEHLIRKERQEIEKATQDLNTAVKVTDDAGWDGNVIHSRFKVEVGARLSVDKKDLSKFKTEITGKRKHVPLIYRARIKRLEGQITELGNRMYNYKLTSKGDWEDFEILFNDDMHRMEKTLSNLIH